MQQVNVNPNDDLQKIIAQTRGNLSLVLSPGVYKPRVTLKGVSNVEFLGNRQVTFDGRGIDDNAVTAFDIDNVFFSGITFSGYGENGFYGEGGKNLRFQNCVFADNHHSGLLTAYVFDVSIVGCEAFGSVEEHGFYLSSSGDRYKILDSKLHGNRKCGIQINATISDEKKVKGPKDGISQDVLIQGCEFWDNGETHIQFAGVIDSAILANTFRGKANKAISLWDDEHGKKWGSKRNRIAHNTFLQQAKAIQLRNGSGGNHIENNSFVGCGVKVDGKGLKFVYLNNEEKDR